MQRFMNSELQEMECAGRRASRSPTFAVESARRLWSGWFECDV